MDEIWELEGVNEKVVEFVKEVSARAVSRRFHDLSGSFTTQSGLRPILFMITDKLIQHSADPAGRLTSLFKYSSYRKCAQTGLTSLGNDIWFDVIYRLRSFPQHRVPVVQALLDAGVPTNISDQSSPLRHLCAWWLQRHDENIADVAPTVDLLLGAKANVNARDKYGDTLLWCLLCRSHPFCPSVRDVMAQLIRAGVDVSVQNRPYDGWSCLHIAVRRRHSVEVVEDLIAAGADRDARDRDGNSPADHDTNHRYQCLHN